jgi:hypothetical protein
MNSSTHTTQNLVAGIASVLAVAVLAVPSALAAGDSRYGPAHHPGTQRAPLTRSAVTVASHCPCNQDLPLESESRAVTRVAAAAPTASPGRCPCNQDLPLESESRAVTRAAAAAPTASPGRCPCNQDPA